MAWRPRACPRRAGLLEGTTAHGFKGELWTLDRIAKVIWRLTAVRHHAAHVWALLRYRLRWTVQRPRHRAAERDQAAIDHWVKTDCPGSKNARRRKAARSTGSAPRWPPRCAMAPGGGCQLCFHVQAGSYDTDTLIVVLGELGRLLGGQEGHTVVGHPARPPQYKMKAWIAGHRHRLVVERLSAYAPELNPVEGCGPTSRVRAASCQPVLSNPWRVIEQTPPRHLAGPADPASGLLFPASQWTLGLVTPLNPIP